MADASVESPIALAKTPLPGGPPEHASGTASARSARPSAGLVKTETSDTRPVHVVRGSELAELNRRRRCGRMRTALLACSDLQQRQLQATATRWRAALLTLTYRRADEWEPRHISDCLKHLRHWCARRSWKLAYAWKAEMQKRGAVHYHVIVWLPIALGLRSLKLDNLAWWPHGMTNFQWARKDPVRYIAKYLSKVELKSMPKGIRMHGRGGLDAETRVLVRFALLPRYVRTHFGTGDVVRANGGGWLNRETGEWLEAVVVRIDWSS